MRVTLDTGPRTLGFNLVMKRPGKTLKRLLLILAAIVAAVAVVLAVNAARFTSRQVDVPPVERIELDAEQLAAHLSRAVGFRTISHEDPSQVDGEAFAALHDYLRETFPRVHDALEKEIFSEHSLLFRWPAAGGGQEPILLMSHLDVVPVEEETLDEWTQPPWEGRIAEGYIWGRGTLDVKDGVLAILEAAELLLEQGFQPARDVYLAFGHDEEVGGSEGNARIAAALKERDVRFEFVLDEGGFITHRIVPGVSAPVALVNVAEKGYASVELTAEGEGGHSSIPPPQTAVGILAAAIEQLESNPMPARLTGATGTMFDYVGPEMPWLERTALANRWLFAPLLKWQFASAPAINASIRTTTAATMFSGGVQDNVLPTAARAVVNFRILPGDSVEGVLDHVEQTVDDPRVAVRQLGASSEPSPVSAVDSPGFVTIQRTIREVFPDALVAPGLMIGASDSRHYVEVTENTYRFIPTLLTSDDVSRIHGINERVGVENYVDVVRFFVRLIQNAAGGESE